MPMCGFDNEIAKRNVKKRGMCVFRTQCFKQAKSLLSFDLLLLFLASYELILTTVQCYLRLMHISAKFQIFRKNVLNRHTIKGTLQNIYGT